MVRLSSPVPAAVSLPIQLSTPVRNKQTTIISPSLGCDRPASSSFSSDPSSDSSSGPPPPGTQQRQLFAHLPTGPTTIEYTVNARPLTDRDRAALPNLNPTTSSFAVVAPTLRQPWTASALRRALLADIQKRRNPSSSTDHTRPARLHARQTEQLVHQYVQALQASPLAHLYTTRLEGTPASSPLRPDRWWHYHRQACASCRHLPIEWEQYRPLNHHNTCWFSHILAILYHGWIPVFDRLPDPFSYDNSASIDRAPTAVAAEHEKALAFGAVVPEPSDYVSPLLAAIRPHEVDEAIRRLQALGVETPQGLDQDLDHLNRLIREHQHRSDLLKPVKARNCLDLSRALNECLQPWPFSYHSVDDALAILRPGSYMGKLDYTRMYNQLPLHPAVRKFFAYRWTDGVVHTCHRAPFGGTSTPAFANLLGGGADHLVLQHLTQDESVFVTDDSFIEGDTEATCLSNIQKATAIKTDLGWILNHDKTEGPSQRLTFLGIEIDTVQQTLAIPAERLRVIQVQVTEFLAEPKLTVRDAQSLAGKLQWVATVFPHGRPYIAALYDGTGGRANSQPYHLTPQGRSDLHWWQGKLHSLVTAAEAAEGCKAWTSFNFAPVPEPIHVYSDASGDLNLGWSLIIRDTVYHGSWVEPQHTTSTYLELIPLLHLLTIHGAELQGSLLVCHTDNAANAIALNRGSTMADSARDLFRQIYSLACEYNITILGDWCPRDDLDLLDSISKQTDA